MKKKKEMKMKSKEEWMTANNEQLTMGLIDWVEGGSFFNCNLPLPSECVPVSVYIQKRINSVNILSTLPLFCLIWQSEGFGIDFDG